MVNLAAIEAARERIRGSVRPTPCRRSETLSQIARAEVYLKYENMQLTGSFKERGASNKLMSLDAASRSRGVICASAGNHAQGVAFHARRLGIDATVVMPEQTPIMKVERTRQYGARVVLYGASYEDAFAEAQRIEAEEGRTFIHAFDDDEIIAGQGTLGLELLEDVPNLDAVVVGVGGGGLFGGVATAVKAIRPEAKMIGVQTTKLPSMKRALEAGEVVTIPAARSIAEGIATRRVGDKTFAIAKELMDDIVLVSDEEVAEAVLLLIEQEKTVVEGAGAAAAAAVREGKLDIVGKNVALVLSGGNIDVQVISRIIERGLVRSGRRARLMVKLPDVAGSLAGLTRIVADARANVLEIQHDRTRGTAGLGEALVDLVLETRGSEHLAEVEAALVERGYEVTRH